MASVLDRMSGTLVGGQLPTSSWEQSAMGGVLRFQLGRPITPSASDGCDAGRWGESAHQLHFARRRGESAVRGRKERRRFPPAAQFWFSRLFTPRIDSNNARPMTSNPP